MMAQYLAVEYGLVVDTIGRGRARGREVGRELEGARELGTRGADQCSLTLTNYLVF